MQIILNGEQRQLPQGMSVEELMAALQVDIRKVAVERNLEIVPRSTFAATQLQEDDRVEIVQFVGGG